MLNLEDQYMITMITNSYSQHGLLMDGGGVLCHVYVVVAGLEMHAYYYVPSCDTTSGSPVQLITLSISLRPFPPTGQQVLVAGGSGALQGGPRSAGGAEGEVLEEKCAVPVCRIATPS